MNPCMAFGCFELRRALVCSVHLESSCRCMLLFESLLRSGFSSETTIPYLLGKRSGAMNDVRLLDRCFLFASCYVRGGTADLQ